MDTRNFSNINEFCTTLCENGLETVILCYTDEWGPSQGEGHSVHCGPRQEMLALAYHEGAIWRCTWSGEDAERSKVQALVESYGLKWEERSRNNAKYGE